jgi:2-methylcitrate dehydratase PrpD
MTSCRSEKLVQTRQICEFLNSTSYDDIDTEAIEYAKKMVTDTIAAMISGSNTEISGLVKEGKTSLRTDTGPSRVIGTGLAGTASDASMLMGVMAHALDFDDVHHEMGGHPSAPVLSALLPVAEQQGASGQELLTAFVLGTEVEISLANVLNPGLYEEGWHPTSVVGSIGAAAAVGKLLDFDTQTLQHALGIAASEAGGIKANFGTMTKPLHVGNAARSGVEAADLASRGFTADRSALEKEFGGFCSLFQGDSEYEFGDHIESLSDPYCILDPPVGFKPYPCCGSTHSSIDAALEIRERDGFSAADIESLKITEHPRRLGHTDTPNPESSLDAKFSVQYCVAIAIEEGDIWFDHFSEDVTSQGKYKKLCDKVTTVGDESLFSSREWGARLDATVDGEQFTVEVDHPKGSAENPLTESELKEKYHHCVGNTLDRDRSQKSLFTIRELDSGSPVESLLDCLTKE